MWSWFIAIELPFAFLSIGPLFLGILGFKSNQQLPSWISTLFNLRRPPGGLFIFFDCFVFGVLFSYYKTNEKRNKWALIQHSWNMIDLLTVGLLFFHLFDLQLSSPFGRNGISSCSKEIIQFLVFRLICTWVLCFSFLLFSQMSALIVQKRKVCCIWFVLSFEVNN